MLEPEPIPVDADRDTINKAISREQPLIDTLKFHGKIYNGEVPDLTPYALTRLYISDMSDASSSLAVSRRYKLKKNKISAIKLIAQIEKMIEINNKDHVLDPTWLEAEYIAAIQMRRNILFEIRNRDIWKNRNNPDYLKTLMQKENL